MQDVPAAHMARLLQYMYTGATEAGQQELPDILNTATKLQIRGFGLGSSPNEKHDHTKAFNESLDGEKKQNVSSGQYIHKNVKNNVKKVCGRKSSVPKKLKFDENETNSSGNHQQQPFPKIPFVDQNKFSILGSYLNSFQPGMHISLMFHKSLIFLIASESLVKDEEELTDQLRNEEIKEEKLFLPGLDK